MEELTIVSVCAANKYLIKKGEIHGRWLHFPMDKKDLLKAVNEIYEMGPEEPGESKFRCCYNLKCECDIPRIVEFVENGADLFDLNDVATEIAKLDKWNMEKLEALLESDITLVPFMTYILTLIKELDQYLFYKGASNAEDVGRCYVKSLIEEDSLEEDIVNYIKYKKLGRRILRLENGCFTSLGYIQEYFPIRPKRYCLEMSEEEKKVIDARLEKMANITKDWE